MSEHQLYQIDRLPDPTQKLHTAEMLGKEAVLAWRRLEYDYEYMCGYPEPLITSMYSDANTHIELGWAGDTTEDHFGAAQALLDCVARQELDGDILPLRAQVLSAYLPLFKSLADGESRSPNDILRCRSQLVNRLRNLSAIDVSQLDPEIAKDVKGHMTEIIFLILGCDPARPESTLLVALQREDAGEAVPGAGQYNQDAYRLDSSGQKDRILQCKSTNWPLDNFYRKYTHDIIPLFLSSFLADLKSPLFAEAQPTTSDHSPRYDVLVAAMIAGEAGTQRQQQLVAAATERLYEFIEHFPADDILNTLFEAAWVLGSADQQATNDAFEALSRTIDSYSAANARERHRVYHARLFLACGPALEQLLAGEAIAPAVSRDVYCRISALLTDAITEEQQNYLLAVALVARRGGQHFFLVPDITPLKHNKQLPVMSHLKLHIFDNGKFGKIPLSSFANIVTSCMGMIAGPEVPKVQQREQFMQFVVKDAAAEPLGLLERAALDRATDDFCRIVRVMARQISGNSGSSAV